MIPSEDEDFLADEELEVEDDPSLTYAMNMNTKRIQGTVDDLDAVIQTIYKILNTERYEYEIYSWDFGIELVDLYGKDITYVVPELQRRIEDALSTDERIVACGNFNFENVEKGILHVTFTVSTIYGDAEIERAVEY